MKKLCNAAGQTEAEFLAAYRPGDYPHPSVTVDILVFSLEKETPELLMIRRGNHPYLGSWALPGGFTEPEETTEESARRELMEETHVEGLPLESIGFYSGPGRDPRGWTMSQAFLAAADRSALHVAAGDDAGDAAWFRVTYRRGTDGLHIRLQKEDETLMARVALRQEAGPLGMRTVLGEWETEGIAFDHCKMIARALLRLQRAGKLPE